MIDETLDEEIRIRNTVFAQYFVDLGIVRCLGNEDYILTRCMLEHLSTRFQCVSYTEVNLCAF